MKRSILSMLAVSAVQIALAAGFVGGAELPSIFGGPPKAARPTARSSASDKTSKSPKYAPPPFEVALRPDKQLTQALMELPEDWIKKLFPNDEAVYVEKYPSDKLQAVYTFSQGKLNGPAARLYESGGMSALANYAMSDREGTLRLWEENKRRLLYAEYKRDKKHGTVCLFREDLPWFVQECDMGDVTAEFLVKWNEGAGEATARQKLASEDLRETAAARTRLTELEAELDRNETEVKKALREWFWERDKQIKQKRVAKQSSARRDQQRKKEQAEKKSLQVFWRNALRSAGF